MTSHLQTRLLNCEKRGNLRKLTTFPYAIDFSSNDYLGLGRSLAFHHSILEEWKMNCSSLNGFGSTGSRLLTGNSEYTEQLEARIAAFHSFEAGLLFNCGYMANVGLLTTIAHANSIVFFDAAIHASTQDGIRLSRSLAYPFRHNDPSHLEMRLKNSSPRSTRFICIESIYSTDGSIAPLFEICELAKKYEAHLIVDEAHAVGVCGPGGRGLVAELGLNDRVFAQVTTFGKGLGTHGAAIFGSQILKHALINFATPYIYTTALPFQVIASIKCSYDLFPEMDQERAHLQTLIQIFRASFTTSSLTHIQPIPISGNASVKMAAQILAKNGFDVRPLMSPTIQKGRELLRICLHAFNTQKEVLDLIQHIQSLKDFFNG